MFHPRHSSSSQRLTASRSADSPATRDQHSLTISTHRNAPFVAKEYNQPPILELASSSAAKAIRRYTVDARRPSMALDGPQCTSAGCYPLKISSDDERCPLVPQGKGTKEMRADMNRAALVGRLSLLRSDGKIFVSLFVVTRTVHFSSLLLKTRHLWNRTRLLSSRSFYVFLSSHNLLFLDLLRTTFAVF
jgi:hypothetical protein